MLPHFTGCTMPILAAAQPQNRNVVYIVPAPGPAAPQVAQARAPDHDVLEQIILGINIHEHEEPNAREIARARYMLAAHHVDALTVRRTMGCLTVGHNNGPRFVTTDAERRASLAALAGIAIGFAPVSAKQLVDEARGKPLPDVARYVAQQAFVLGTATGVVVGGGYVALRGYDAALDEARAAVLGDAAGRHVAGTWLYGGVAFAGSLMVAAGLYLVADGLAAVNRDNEHVLESTLAKDIRIFRGLQDGHLTLPNLPPRRPA